MKLSSSNQSAINQPENLLFIMNTQPSIAKDNETIPANKLNSWLRDELLEFKIELENASHPAHNHHPVVDEALDCIGLLTMGADPSHILEESDSLNYLLIRAAHIVSMLSSNDLNYLLWFKKQAERGRRKIELTTLRSAAAKVYSSDQIRLMDFRFKFSENKS